MPMWWDGCDIVRCGFWINWSEGTVNGSTLTLPTTWGLILVGFLALFVKQAGEHLWGTICYAIHQTSAAPQPRDDIYHQYQLVLRNTESEASFVSKLLKVGWSHKGSRLNAYKRSFGLIVLALLHGVGFYAAGGLSSRFIASSDEVQMLSDVENCGWMAVPKNVQEVKDDKSFEEANALVVMTRYGYRKSAAYSRSCYMQSGGNSTACGTYMQSTIGLNISTEVDCPFDENICNGKAIRVDTGYVRSDQQLGINTKPEDSISVRKIMTCVPIAGEKYSDGWQPVPAELNYTWLPKAALMKGYKFGTEEDASSSDPYSMYTFLVHNYMLITGDQPYNLGWVTASVNNPENEQARSFNPIPELASPTADLNLLSLVNRNYYRTPMEDPWFRAENVTKDINIGTSYSASEVLSFLGCQESYEFCNLDRTKCSPVTGLYGINASDPNSSPSLNPTPRAVFELMWKIMWVSQLNFQLGFIGRENLVANEYLWDAGFGFGISAALPVDHWHREVVNWMNTSLSAMQRAPAAFAQPPEFDIGPGVSSRNHIVPAEEGQMQELCRKMKGRSKAHMSFSVLGLFLTICLGLFVMISYLAVPKTVASFQKRTGAGQHKRLEWIETSAFQLQRMAAEGRGIGPWMGRDEDVPRLERRGNAFNLTEQSLTGAYSRVESYDIAKRGLGSPSAESYEMGGLGYHDRKMPNVDETSSGYGLLSERDQRNMF